MRLYQDNVNPAKMKRGFVSFSPEQERTHDFLCNSQNHPLLCLAMK